MNRAALTLTLLLIGFSAAAQDAALQQCRTLADPAARLKCYDAIPLATAAAVPATAAAVRSAPVAATAPTPAAPATASAPAPVAAPASQFGLAPKTPDADLDRIESRIDGAFDGWRPNSLVRLANGQVWQVVDDTSRFLDLASPRVWVRRGALGSFHLEIEGTNHSPRVKRVK